MEKREVKRGEVFYADLSPVVGSEQGGVRPVLIVQNDIGNRFSPTVIAAAITSKQDKTNLPTHIPVKAGTAFRATAWCCWSKFARWINTACAKGPGAWARKRCARWTRRWA